MIKEQLENGLVRITFDDRRWYLHEETGKYYPSATWILDYFPKGEGFKRWLADKVQSWEEAQEILTVTGERGSDVHTGMEDLASGLTIDHDAYSPEVYRYLIGGRNWMRRVRPYIIATEQPFVETEAGFGGTTDLVCDIDRGLTQWGPTGKLALEDSVEPTGSYDRWLIDYKTSKSIHDSHEIQVSAYAMALGYEIEGGIDRVGIVQLGAVNKDGFKFKEVKDVRENFSDFLAAKRFWHRANKNKDGPGFVIVPPQLRADYVPPFLDEEQPIAHSEVDDDNDIPF
jgi:hypothetical protein